MGKGSKQVAERDKDRLCLVFIPALVTLLYKAESTLGEPLTEGQVLAIRDGASCVALPYDMARAGEESRGYPDIVAEDAWNEWQRVRQELFPDAEAR
jgi:hypothetical protein